MTMEVRHRREPTVMAARRRASLDMSKGSSQPQQWELARQEQQLQREQSGVSGGGAGQRRLQARRMSLDSGRVDQFKQQQAQQQQQLDCPGFPKTATAVLNNNVPFGGATSLDKAFARNNGLNQIAARPDDCCASVISYRTTATKTTMTTFVNRTTTSNNNKFIGAASVVPIGRRASMNAISILPSTTTANNNRFPKNNNTDFVRKPIARTQSCDVCFVSEDGDWGSFRFDENNTFNNSTSGNYNNNQSINDAAISTLLSPGGGNSKDPAAATRTAASLLSLAPLAAALGPLPAAAAPANNSSLPQRRRLPVRSRSYCNATAADAAAHNPRVVCALPVLEPAKKALAIPPKSDPGSPHCSPRTRFANHRTNNNRHLEHHQRKCQSAHEESISGPLIYDFDDGDDDDNNNEGVAEFAGDEEPHSNNNTAAAAAAASSGASKQQWLSPFEDNLGGQTNNSSPVRSRSRQRLENHPESAVAAGATKLNCRTRSSAAGGGILARRSNSLQPTTARVRRNSVRGMTAANGFGAVVRRPSASAAGGEEVTWLRTGTTAKANSVACLEATSPALASRLQRRRASVAGALGGGGGGTNTVTAEPSTLAAAAAPSTYNTIRGRAVSRRASLQQGLTTTTPGDSLCHRTSTHSGINSRVALSQRRASLQTASSTAAAEVSWTRGGGGNINQGDSKNGKGDTLKTATAARPRQASLQTTSASEVNWTRTPNNTNIDTLTKEREVSAIKGTNALRQRRASLQTTSAPDLHVTAKTGNQGESSPVKCSSSPKKLSQRARRASLQTCSAEEVNWVRSPNRFHRERAKLKAAADESEQLQHRKGTSFRRSKSHSSLGDPNEPSSGHSTSEHGGDSGHDSTPSTRRSPRKSSSKSSCHSDDASGTTDESSHHSSPRRSPKKSSSKSSCNGDDAAGTTDESSHHTHGSAPSSPDKSSFESPQKTKSSSPCGTTTTTTPSPRHRHSSKRHSLSAFQKRSEKLEKLRSSSPTTVTTRSSRSAASRTSQTSQGSEAASVHSHSTHSSSGGENEEGGGTASGSGDRKELSRGGGSSRRTRHSSSKLESSRGSSHGAKEAAAAATKILSSRPSRRRVSTSEDECKEAERISKGDGSAEHHHHTDRRGSSNGSSSPEKRGSTERTSSSPHHHHGSGDHQQPVAGPSRRRGNGCTTTTTADCDAKSVISSISRIQARSESSAGGMTADTQTALTAQQPIHW